MDPNYSYMLKIGECLLDEILDVLPGEPQRARFIYGWVSDMVKSTFGVLTEKASPDTLKSFQDDHALITANAIYNRQTVTIISAKDLDYQTEDGARYNSAQLLADLNVLLQKLKVADDAIGIATSERGRQSKIEVRIAEPIVLNDHNSGKLEIILPKSAPPSDKRHFLNLETDTPRKMSEVIEREIARSDLLGVLPMWKKHGISADIGDETFIAKHLDKSTPEDDFTYIGRVLYLNQTNVRKVANAITNFYKPKPKNRPKPSKTTPPQGKG